MTVEDNSAPTESVPRPRPRTRTAARSKLLGNVVAAAFLALSVLFALGVVATYFLRDRTATSPGPQTVTVTPKASAGPADGRFFSSLAIYGISDNGNEAVRQRFMEFGHHTCFSLLPPRPQTLDATVSGIMAAENQDVAAGSPWSPQFTHDDAEHLAQAAIGAYCPDVPK
ncbi:hypothetical protein BN971_04549 [Mycobacterium bohemicum DSM 44277]|jgi:hypothetical protein|uniref:DUF732 domain-containing protein n=2 Tax=Mycobacterium bohemicum TaxID=56425 RepID=A0A1X1R0S9_MYCBE|nr:DUF732 domain-containing protein [Mycobacterium bohemicum]MCV6969387.1 DUF732 domain-containing protein [Mycobacterium bohemicum]ORU97630.1 hypothetical protein AWB93_16735 [Mycobacterium bohemicum]CPR13240.1 hypothetical protein BN971_04549 [Mycobacterium bohemicum DSM 44277]